ncbi:MAG TPA: hypothetical protein VNX26_06460 [Candidatus Acidoferrum sp.]|jgi:hypothetical protein|nr:hypothetical protein [Candidatus Acidoferrum sp.]
MTSKTTSKIEELIGQREIARKNGDGTLVMNLQDEIAVAVNERDRGDFLAQVKQPD